MATIRPATLHDMPGVYRVCLETGDSGLDATSQYQNHDLLGHVYVGPYLIGEPRHAFVVADRDGVAGYCFAVEDTLAFEEWEREHWWPALQAQYPRAHDPLAHDARAQDSATAPRPGPEPGPESGPEPWLEDEQLIRLIHEPESTPSTLVGDYPAHLHIDMLPRVQGHGFGRTLIELIVDGLREREIRGVHLGVSPQNVNAIAFYQHLGFTILFEESDVTYMGMGLS